MQSRGNAARHTPRNRTIRGLGNQLPDAPAGWVASLATRRLIASAMGLGWPARLDRIGFSHRNGRASARSRGEGARLRPNASTETRRTRGLFGGTGSPVERDGEVEVRLRARASRCGVGASLSVSQQCWLVDPTTLGSEGQLRGRLFGGVGVGSRFGAGPAGGASAQSDPSGTSDLPRTRLRPRAASALGPPPTGANLTRFGATGGAATGHDSLAGCDAFRFKALRRLDHGGDEASLGTKRRRRCRGCALGRDRGLEHRSSGRGASGQPSQLAGPAFG